MNSIKFGMPTLVEYKGLEENINLCKKLNLDFIEINLNLPQFNPDIIDKAYILDVINKENIFCTLHTPDIVDITNFDKEIRNAHINFIKKTICLAKEINATIINMHMNLGTYFTMPNSKIYLNKVFYNEYMEYIDEFIGVCEKELLDTEIKICIENTGVYYLGFIQDAVENMLRSNTFKLTWDVGHGMGECKGLTDKEYILSYIDNLYHMHIHDSLNKKCHLPIGDGELNFNEIMNIANKYDCRCVIETKDQEGLVKSVKKLKIVE